MMQLYSILKILLVSSLELFNAIDSLMDSLFHALTRIYHHLVVAAFTRNYYVKGIDPTDILLLCDLNNPDIPLKDVRMTTQQAAIYNNPIVLNDLNQFEDALLCAEGTSSQLLSSLSVIGNHLDLEVNQNSCRLSRLSYSNLEPVLTSNYSGMSTQTYTVLGPSNIDLNIPPYSTQVQLTTNLGSGTWHTPLSTVTDTTHIIQTFTLTSQGRYIFSTNRTWNGDDRQIFMIDIAAIGLLICSFCANLNTFY